jgi:GDP-4-dehydro-6-deoxy-D-mannose reductase
VNRPTLVTGARGFAGSHLLDQLIAEPAPLVGWYRHSGRTPIESPTPPAEDRHLRWMAVDLLDPAAVVSAIDELRPGLIFHCAGAPQVAGTWRESCRALESNALGTHHLLESIRQVRLDARVVIAGSAQVYRPAPGALTEDHPLGPSNPYGVSKLAQELLALQAAEEGLDVVLARPFNHIGPRQQPQFAASSFARQIALAEAGRAAPVLEVGNLEAQRDVTDVRDTVRAYRRLATAGRPGRPYNICTGRAPSVGELLDRLRALARVPVEVRVDAALLRPNDTPILLGDPRRIHEELGWEPEFELERTLSDLLDFWRSRAAAGTS